MSALLTGPSPIVPFDDHQSISIDISDFRMTPTIAATSYKSKTPTSALPVTSGANSQLDV